MSHVVEVMSGNNSEAALFCAQKIKIVTAIA